jgi:hypothetical protein
MRPNPHRIVVVASGGPDAVAATYEVHHTQFPEIRGTGRTRSDSVNDLLNRMDNAFGGADDGRKSLIVEAYRDALAFLADGDDSPAASPRPRILGVQEPLVIVNGDDLYEVRFYATEDQWRETMAAPPDILERIRGLGWIGATFVRSLGGTAPARPGTDRRVRDRRASYLGGPLVRPADSRRGERRGEARRRSGR